MLKKNRSINRVSREFEFLSKHRRQNVRLLGAIIKLFSVRIRTFDSTGSLNFRVLFFSRSLHQLVLSALLFDSDSILMLILYRMMLFNDGVFFCCGPRARVSDFYFVFLVVDSPIIDDFLIRPVALIPPLLHNAPLL